MKKSIFFGVSIFCAFLWTESAEAVYSVCNGELVDFETVPNMQSEKHYQSAVKAYAKKDWAEAAGHFKVLALNFLDTPEGKDSYMFLGVCQFNLGDLETADDNFSEYLKSQNNPSYFEDAVRYKLAIANKFTMGAKRKFWGLKVLPKIVPAQDKALEIYEEIITACPCHDLAAQALYSKGVLHWKNQEFAESIDTFQQLIRKFPKHELAPDSYTAINKVYLQQSKLEYQNPDLLALADLNYKKFSQDFPGEERLSESKKDAFGVKEVYASGMLNTGQFYEKTSKPQAAVIYYKSVLRQFSDTHAARFAENRLMALGCTSEEIACAAAEK